jgi:hypothetical protein
VQLEQALDEQISEEILKLLTKKPASHKKLKASVLPTEYSPSGLFLKGISMLAGSYVIWLLAMSIYGYDIFN